MLQREAEIVATEYALENQNGGTNAGLPELYRLLDDGNRETVGKVFQCLRTPHGAMAIGIGLDHRERAASMALSGQEVVVTERIEIDTGAGGSH